MRHYSEDPAMCRVDFFKESGKWYCTEAIQFSSEDWDEAPSDALRAVLRRELHGRPFGMTAVCLEPYVKNSFPVMVRSW